MEGLQVPTALHLLLVMQIFGLTPHLFPDLAKLQLTVQQEAADGAGPASHLSQELSRIPLPHMLEAETVAVPEMGVNDGVMVLVTVLVMVLEMVSVAVTVTEDETVPVMVLEIVLERDLVEDVDMEMETEPVKEEENEVETELEKEDETELDKEREIELETEFDTLKL